LGHNEFAHHKLRFLPLEFGFASQNQKFRTILRAGPTEKFGSEMSLIAELQPSLSVTYLLLFTIFVAACDYTPVLSWIAYFRVLNLLSFTITIM
jgi:hypothetical protein